MTRFALFCLLGLLLFGCKPNDLLQNDDDDANADDDDDDNADDDSDDDDGDPCDDFPGEVICDNIDAIYCDDLGDVDHIEECDTGSGEYCLWGSGCVICYPGTTSCDNNDVVECSPDGSEWTVIEECLEEDGFVCSNGACVELCDLANQQSSTIGCLFYAVDTDQHDMGPETIQYAVAVSNVHATLDASVIIESNNGGWGLEWSGIVGPQQLATVPLPDRHVDDSAINVGGAYRITSTIPIIAYQFNPVDGQSSYLSDASLLLPVSAVDSVYRVPGWDQAVDNTGTIQHCSMNVVATADNTTVTVTPSIPTLGGTGVPAGTPGTPFQVTLVQAGDYLQVASNADQQSLSGTLVETDPAHEVAVFSGHECALIPTNLCCCDHLEEQIFGIQTWGEGYVAARIPHRGPPPEPVLWEIIAGNDPVSLTFSAHPEVTGVPGSVNLAAGEVFRFETSGTAANPGDLEITGTDAFLLTQYMKSSESSPSASLGDPAMVQAVPVEQYLHNYVILVPGTWNNDYLIITRPVGAIITVGGVDIDAWPAWSESSVIGSGAYEAVRLLVVDGVHVLEGTDPFGVVVVGFDTHDSYAYPGGLNQARINDL